MNIDSLHRRAALNGVIAAMVTLGLGLGVMAGVEAVGDGDDPPPVSPSPTPSTEPAPICTPTWEIAQTADPGESSNLLSDVTALSSAEAWAVGGSGDPEAPLAVLIERWDGTAWTAEEGPNPGSQINELLAVDAAEPNDVWAVGRTASGFGDRPLVLHYDGTAWLEVVLPEDVTGVLSGVAAIAPDDVWVVGFTGDPVASLEEALILHWDGQLWAVVDAGRAVGTGKSALLDVEAAAPDDLWVTGYLHNNPLIAHFDGASWSRSDTGLVGETNAIAPLVPTDVWAVGAPIQRFDGTSWVPVAEVRSEGRLLGVAAVSQSDVWAVGVRAAGEAATKSLVLRFDGRRWTAVEGPGIPGSDALTGVDALEDGTVLAVGYKDVEPGRRTVSIRGTTCFPEA